MHFCHVEWHFTRAPSWRDSFNGCTMCNQICFTAPYTTL